MSPVFYWHSQLRRGGTIIKIGARNKVSFWVLSQSSSRIWRSLGHVTWWSNIKYSRGAIDGLLQSGGLSLVENGDLRRVLASMPSRYDFTTGAELNDQYTTNNVVIPFLNTHSSLSQIANTMATGRPGTGIAPTPPVYPVSERQDHTGLLRHPEFLGILVQEHWNHISLHEVLKIL